MKYPLLLARVALATLCTALFEEARANPVVRFRTDAGDIDVVLLQDVAPKTVANFLGYVTRQDYDNTFIHRSVANFIIQGGGYHFVAGSVTSVPQQPPVVNEFSVSNTRGTLAMAKLGGNPDSATNQWFFNESDDNAANLDNQNGGFTVFGRIFNSSGLASVDLIGSLPTYNLGSPFDQLPLKNYGGGAVVDSNLVHVISVRVVGPSLTVSHPSSAVARLEIVGAPVTAYPIQSSTSLLGGSFSLLTTLTTDVNGRVSYDDPTAAPQKFYRLVLP